VSEVSVTGRPNLRSAHESGRPSFSSALILAGTPIGNAGDASPRLIELLETADLIAAEDTRKLRALAARLGLEIRGKVVPCHEHNEAHLAPGLLDAVAAGQAVVLVTDAGMPAVSDPGYRLVEQAVARGLPVTCVPGPSAVIVALALSGLPSDRFAFEGFLPRKPNARRRVLQTLNAESRTLVFFEAPHRILESVQDFAAVFGPDRPAALCRELTKIHEEVLRGTLSELTDRLTQRAAEPGGIRGEFVIVIGPATSDDHPTRSLGSLTDEVRELTGRGASLKEAAQAVAAKHGVSKRELYNQCLSDKVEQ